VNATPAQMPKTKRLVPSGNLQDLQAAYRVSKPRPYGLGERRPNTLPGVFKDSETVDQDRRRTRELRSVRRWVESANSAGFLY
jgi:hypothetical protein